MTTLEQAGIECFEMDVTDLDTMKAVKDQAAKKKGGKIDILVNNAGQGNLRPCTLQYSRRIRRRTSSGRLCHLAMFRRFARGRVALYIQN
jgi:NAD(P)-dependent dehydrogenase (short-subunit alcohol dehydrogenase family)